MQLITSIMFVLAASLHRTASQATNTARVINHCPFVAYVQSVPNNNAGPPGPVTALSANGSGTIFSEPLRINGSTIKTGTTRALSAPLTLGYTPSNGLIYYDLADQSGNPFLRYRNALIPGVTTCPRFDCAANNETCYSNGSHQRIYACRTTSLTLTLCL